MSATTEPRIELRSHQIIPGGDWKVCRMRGGRGAGKTTAGAAWVNRIASEGGAKTIALLGPRLAHVHDVMVPALMRLSAPENPVQMAVFRSRLVWDNGSFAMILANSHADIQGKLFGVRLDAAWGDELPPELERILFARLYAQRGSRPQCLLTYQGASISIETSSTFDV